MTAPPPGSAFAFLRPANLARFAFSGTAGMVAGAGYVIYKTYGSMRTEVDDLQKRMTDAEERLTSLERELGRLDTLEQKVDSNHARVLAEVELLKRQVGDLQKERTRVKEAGLAGLVGMKASSRS
ncbi:hypothetical protein M427DRAFT_51949 [Gonapodya prolifera JEL478]|uniref:Uncharacterized protein n=1 Tax=Gonapodya prolifera (strain JEL478) TaxID=1344416 RepID=A0A139AX05_GONPJ|nr:hypothetical protein M427DRAFT_51949 [Gonapodya prolifera JEL478]|eukprot:KXS21005.1 hypothetical protein M427DRAFT_51949 [Gonapodya prolifera JEL478]